MNLLYSSPFLSVTLQISIFLKIHLKTVKLKLFYFPSQHRTVVPAKTLKFKQLGALLIVTIQGLDAVAILKSQERRNGPL